MNKEAKLITPEQLSVIINKQVDAIWTYYKDKLEYVLEEDFVEDEYDEVTGEYEKGYVESHWINYNEIKDNYEF